MKRPSCTIIAGPNGAGKTTFAMDYLPSIDCRIFLNADMIASGLAPFAAETKQLEAGKLFLAEIERAIVKRENFAFETTLSGGSHLPRIRRMLEDGWRVSLIYLWIPGIETSLKRVRERVRQGGHNIPAKDIQRRYARSLRNLLVHYGPVCTEVRCHDNSTPERKLIFRRLEENVIIKNQALFTAIKGEANISEQTIFEEPPDGIDKISEQEMSYNIASPGELDEHTIFIMDCLHRAVTNELERKRKLGYDAIIVENDTIMRLHPDGSKTAIGPVR